MIKSGAKYRNIYILQSRGDFSEVENEFIPMEDLVLTMDFALHRYISQEINGDVEYLEKIERPEIVWAYNTTIEEYLRNWYLDSNQDSKLIAFGIDFGNALRIEYWSEFLFYMRLRINLEFLKEIEYRELFVADSDERLLSLLGKAQLPYILIQSEERPGFESYFFDIHKYMSNQLHSHRIRDRVISIMRNSWLITRSAIKIKNFNRGKRNSRFIYFHNYHPTRPLAEIILKEMNIGIIFPYAFGKNSINRLINPNVLPKRNSFKLYRRMAETSIKDVSSLKIPNLILPNGEDVSDEAFNLILTLIKPQIQNAIRECHSVVKFFNRNKLVAELMISNLGMQQEIIHSYAKANGIPSFCIINGLLTSKHRIQRVESDFINSYGKSIKQNYFLNKPRVECLGDPRMDKYFKSPKYNHSVVTLEKIVVGASGFNSIDLVSHSAAEFDFLSEILISVANACPNVEIVIKVRPNGDILQYKNFVKEFYPNLNVHLISDLPIMECLEGASLYISIYSQTIIEAAVMGIPTIYFKSDCESHFPPFDGNSKLTTAESRLELENLISNFPNNREIFDAFMETAELEKYVGPLDGLSTKRNYDFLMSLVTLEKN